MDIPSGIFGLLRAIYGSIAEFFSKILFYRAYKVSTLYHNHREAIGMPPHKLTNDIEYKIIIKEYYLQRKLISPMIWVKAKGAKLYSKLVLCVTASNDKIRYQDYISLLDVHSIPVQVSLPSIPFRNLEYKNGIVYAPYDDIHVHLLEAYDQDGNAIDLSSVNESCITPLDRLEVVLGRERGDVVKWGEIFNLGFIEREIKEQRINLVAPHLRKPGTFARIRVKLFKMNWLVKIIFWSKNIVTAKQLTREFTSYLNEYEEFKRRTQRNSQKEAA